MYKWFVHVVTMLMISMVVSVLLRLQRWREGTMKNDHKVTVTHDTEQFDRRINCETLYNHSPRVMLVKVFCTLETL